MPDKEPKSRKTHRSGGLPVLDPWGEIKAIADEISDGWTRLEIRPISLVANR